MLYVCPQGCKTDVGMSKPRPTTCEKYGSPYRYTKALKSTTDLKPNSDRRQAEEEGGARPKQRGNGLKRGRGFQASPEQQAKVKGCVCVSCKRDYYEEGAEIQAAHVYPRRL